MSSRNTIAVGGWGSRIVARVGDTVAFTVNKIEERGIIITIECGVGWDHTYREMLTVEAPAGGFNAHCLRNSTHHGVVARNARLVTAAREETTA